MALVVAEKQALANNTGAVSFTLAAGSAVGDLLVLIQADDFYTAAQLLTPTGTAASTWTLRDTFDGGSSLSHIKIWTAPVTTAGAQTVITNWNTPAPDEERGAVIWRIPGAVFDVANHANGAASVSHVAPSLTPASTDEIYCCLWTNNNTGGGNFNYTYPGGAFVGTAEVDVSTLQTFGWGHEPITSGVATGTRTATASVSSAWCAAAVLVKASGAAAVDPGVPFNWPGPGMFLGPSTVPLAWAGADDPPPTGTAANDTGAAFAVAGQDATCTTVSLGITPVSSMAGVADTLGAVTFPVTTTTIGNAVVVGVKTNSISLTVSSMSGGGCTWAKAAGFLASARGRSFEIWVGTVTSVVTASTVTVTWSGSAAAKIQGYHPQEFTYGAPASWTLDGAQSGGFETTVTGLTLPWPSLTASVVGELYFGQGVNSAATPPLATGTPAGFVFVASLDCWCYGITTATGTIAPVQDAGATTQFGGLGALLIATPGGIEADDTGATFTVDAGDATSLVAASDTGSALTVASQDALASVGAADTGAALTVSAQDTTSLVNASDTGAALSIAGLDATVTVAAADTGATMSVAGQDAAVITGAVVAPAEAQVSIAAGNTTSTVSVVDGGVALTVTGQDAAPSVGAMDTGAALTVAAGDTTSTVSTNDSGASFSVAAQDATVTTGTNTSAAAVEATLSVAAQDATVSVSAPASAATFTTAAQDATSLVSASGGSASLAITGQDTLSPPGEVFDLHNFKLTVPVDLDSSGAADEILQPTLSSYYDTSFFYTDSSRQMVFVAPVTGATTSGSSGVRCELREMEAGAEAAWDMATTNRSLTVSGFYDPTSISGGSLPRNEMIIGQIHATGGTPPIYITVETNTSPTRMRVYKDGPGVGNLVTGFTTSDRLAFKIEITGGNVNIYGCIGDQTNLPGTPQFSYAASAFAESTNCYLKAGAYNKTDVSSGSSGQAISTIAYLNLAQGAATVANAGSAAPSIVANDTTATVVANDTGSAFSITAGQALVNAGAMDTGAALTVTAQNTTSLVSASDTGATLSVAAQDATVSTSGSSSPAPAEAAFSVTAGDTTSTLLVPDTGSALTVAGQQALANVGAMDTGAATTVAAQDATSLISTVSDFAALAVSAQDATVVTGSNTSVAAQAVTFTVAANDSTTSVAPTPAEGQLAVAAQDATVAISQSASVNAGVASFGVGGQDAQAATAVIASAVEAVFSTVVQQVAMSVSGSALSALASMVGQDPLAQVPTTFGTLAGVNEEPWKLTGSTQSTYVMTDSRSGVDTLTSSASTDARLTSGVG